MIKIKRAKNGQLFFTVHAKNHKVILTSETYKSKQGVMKGIKATLKVFNYGYWPNMSLIKDETQTT